MRIPESAPNVGLPGLWCDCVPIAPVVQRRQRRDAPGIETESVEWRPAAIPAPCRAKPSKRFGFVDARWYRYEFRRAVVSQGEFGAPPELFPVADELIQFSIADLLLCALPPRCHDQLVRASECACRVASGSISL